MNANLNFRPNETKNILFFFSAATPFLNAYFGQGPSSSPILLQNLRCTGSEARLVNCSHSGVGQVGVTCGHDDDAGVRCRPCECVAVHIKKIPLAIFRKVPACILMFTMH